MKPRVFFLMALLAGSIPINAQASGDSNYCLGGGFYCSNVGEPWLRPENDSRTNLLLYAATRNQIEMLASSAQANWPISRDYFFTPWPERLDYIKPEEKSDNGVRDTLVQQIQRLGLTLSPDELTATRYTQGRFVSNSTASVMQFFAALLDDDALSADERRTLANLRAASFIQQHAPGQSAAIPPIEIQPGSHADDFVRYLQGARAFYQGDYPLAETEFSALRQSAQPWVAETASYMQFRVALNASSERATDEYGWLERRNIDDAQLQTARRYLNDYLVRWPQGRYAPSARDMQRRVDWYLGDWASLMQAYEAKILAAREPAMLLDSVIEADNVLQGSYDDNGRAAFHGDKNAPLITFTEALRALRGDDQESASLETLKPMISGEYASFWDYLSLLQQFKRGDYARVVASINPAQTLSATDILAFSRQVIYGSALEKQKKLSQAEAHWRHLLTIAPRAEQKHYLQMRLSRVLVWRGETAKIFAQDSPVTALIWRAQALKMVADDALLRRQAASAPHDEEKTIALYTLLRRDLERGDARAFLSDVALRNGIHKLPDSTQFEDVPLDIFDWQGGGVESGYACASLMKSAQALVNSPHDGHALNCIGEFFRIKMFAHWGGPEYQLSPSIVEIQYDGRDWMNIPDRLSLYQRAIEDAKTEPEDRAYALYRAVKCFEPSGSNDCGMQQVPETQRKRWFMRLKEEFKGS